MLQQALDKLVQLIDEAGSLNIPDARTAALSTCGNNKQPSVRIINIQKVSIEGLVFFANRNSGKVIQLDQNPNAGLCFYWPGLGEQVIVDGVVERQSGEVSDKHWSKRSRDQQVVAWSSEQGTPAESAISTKEKAKAVRSDSGFSPLNRHPDWDAYYLRPSRIEFWHTSGRRANQRVLYRVGAAGEWEKELINP